MQYCVVNLMGIGRSTIAEYNSERQGFSARRERED